MKIIEVEHLSLIQKLEPEKLLKGGSLAWLLRLLNLFRFYMKNISLDDCNNHLMLLKYQGYLVMYNITANYFPEQNDKEHTFDPS